MPEAHRGWQDSEGGWPALTSNVWRIHPESDRTHPAPYPIELPYRCIRLGSFPGELIVDPFAGSGTTLLAARNLGRDAIGLDRSPEYVRMAEERLSQLTMFGTVA
jgi:site-specific DNA-methyltransferase (adenine-specific)